MSVEFKLLDHFKLTYRLTTNFTCGYSEDDRLFIICEKGIYIIALKGYITSSFPTFSCKKDFMKISNYMPSTDLDGKFLNSGFNGTCYETILRSECETNLNRTTCFEASPICAQWSPRGIVGNTECMLAVLTSFYSLEIYVKYLDENEILHYILVSNVCQEIINVEESQWKYIKRLPSNLKRKEIKRRTETVTPTAFTWSHMFKVNDIERCAIFVGHLNGDISAWKMNLRPSNSNEQSELHFLGRYTTQLQKITILHWHQTREFAGGLSFADSEGKMSVLNVTKLDQETVTMDNELGFLTEPNSTLVDKITVMFYENRTYILVVMQSCLIIYGISEMGDVFDQHVCQVGDLYITGIHHFENVILVLTILGGLKQFTLSIIKDRIVLTEKIISLKMDISNYRTHGFFFSRNMVLMGLLAHPNNYRSMTKSRSHINVFLFNNSLLNPLEILWYNSSESLRDYWDCFEALRLICLKDKRFPWLGLHQDLNYDTLSLLQLKTLRLLAKMSEMVYNSVPVVRDYNIKPYILLHYLVEIKLIVKRINTLLNLRNSRKDLSVFQMRSIDVQNFFLKEMVVKNILAKANVGKNFISEIHHVMSISNELKYPPMVQCIWCGEKIIGPLCVPPHADSRCAISMMPIFLVPAYKCPFCKVLVHREIEKEQIVIYCPYCDIPMDKRYVDENASADNTSSAKEVNKDYAINCEEVKSACFDDCLKEDISFSDIEENSCDFIIFSDSEEESTEEHRELRTLYDKLANASLDEIMKLDSEITDSNPETEISNLGSEISEPSQKILRLDEENV